MGWVGWLVRAWVPKQVVSLIIGIAACVIYVRERRRECLNKTADTSRSRKGQTESALTLFSRRQRQRERSRIEGRRHLGAQFRSGSMNGKDGNLSG